MYFFRWCLLLHFEILAYFISALFIETRHYLGFAKIDHGPTPSQLENSTKWNLLEEHVSFARVYDVQLGALFSGPVVVKPIRFGRWNGAISGRQIGLKEQLRRARRNCNTRSCNRAVAQHRGKDASLALVHMGRQIHRQGASNSSKGSRKSIKIHPK